MGLLAIVLTAVFVTLKLAHVVAWSWLIVVSPLIVSVALLVLVLVFGFVFGALAAIYAVAKGLNR